MSTPLGPGPLRRYLRHGMLPQLAAFEAVLRLGSATRAAEALCIAQPTLSGHLRKLGDALGVRLFEIQGKHLVPTDAARALLPVVKEVFASFERGEHRLAALRGADLPGARLPLCVPRQGDAARCTTRPPLASAARARP